MKSNINLPLPSPLVSLIPIAALVAMLAVTIHLFGSDALGGGSQICLLTATAICALIGMSGYKRRWKHFEKAITKNISGVGTALIILFDYWSLVWSMDDQWGSSHLNLLWYSNYTPKFLSGMYMFDLQHCICNDGKFMDNHCHYRYCLDGNRRGARIRPGMDRRCNHFRSLFWR